LLKNQSFFERLIKIYVIPLHERNNSRNIAPPLATRNGKPDLHIALLPYHAILV
jgi:hypothetical protein